MELLPLAILVPLYFWVAFRISKSKFTRRGVTLFLVAGSLFAVLRVGCWLYLSHRMITHTWSATLSSLSGYLIILYPEAPAMSVAGGISPAWGVFIYATVLAVCSYVWAAPLLLVGTVKRVNLPDASGA
jgi:hypothetical protein